VLEAQPYDKNGVYKKDPYEYGEEFMFPKQIFIAIAIVALVSMACGVNINLPVKNVKVGPAVTEDISVPNPAEAGTVTKLTLNFGAGELSLAPGAQSALVEGKATYNVSDLKPKVTVDGSDVLIETGNWEINSIPKFGDDFKNEWDLKLGDAPMDLSINAGAYKGEFDLGGLAMQSLRISDGASDVRLDFSSPNQVDMDTLRYTTGASHVELSGLANANFENLVFKGGAGSYQFDFSGELKRDSTVTIDAGFSGLTVVVPEGVSTRLFVDSGLSNVDIGGQWEKSGDEYTLSGEGPRLTINVNIGAGSLTLRNH
jgi:hypothetical protein